MKTPVVLLVLLLFAVDAVAQTSAGPQQIAQGGPSAPAGSAAAGASLPTAHTGGGASITAVAIGFTVVAFATAAFGSYNITTTSNH